jgi:hypothetical protein
LKDLYLYYNPGDGISIFPVKAWFDNNNIPKNFPVQSWYWEIVPSNPITPYYYKE